MEIRQATELDIEQLSEVACRTFEDTFRSYYSEKSMAELLETLFSQQALRPYLSDIFILVADSPTNTSTNNSTTTILGYYQKQDIEEPVSYFSGRSEKRSLQLKRMYIDRPCFGLGLGKLLMDHFLQGREGRLAWLTVFGGNARAIRFYGKCGFVRVPGVEVLWSEHLLLDGSKDVDQIYCYKGEEGGDCVEIKRNGYLLKGE